MARVLVIDDSADLRDALAHALLSDGHIVTIADDGERGVALQAEFRADILVTDIFMPNKDGIETILEFKEHYPEVRIIVMSASDRLNNSTYLATARQLGCDVILRKPFRIHELLDAVQSLVPVSAPAPSVRPPT